MVDIHNHLIPAVDDGAQTPEEAIRGLAAMRAAGVRRLVCTPHVDGSLTASPAALERRLSDLDAGWAELQDCLDSASPEVVRGAEVKLDRADVDLADPRLRLNGSRFALVEFAHMSAPPQSTLALFRLAKAGWRPVLGHPERYGGTSNPDLWRDWHRTAVLQVNAGSLIGRYGSAARDAAWSLLELGYAHVVASDYHARGEVDSAAARQAVLERGAAEQAELLFDVNPGRLLDDAEPLGVPALPVAGESRWRKMTSWLR